MSIQIGSKVKLKDGAKGLYELSHYIGSVGTVVAAGDPAKDEWEWFIQFDADVTLGSDGEGLELVKAAFELPTAPGVSFWALGPNEDYWTSFTTYTNGKSALYVEEETDHLVALTSEEILECYDQFKPIEAMQEITPFTLTETPH